MHNNTCVEYIDISNCSSLSYFAVGQLPPTLKRLTIDCCNMLISLDGDDVNNCGNNTSLLEELTIWDYPSLKSITPSRELPAILKYLQIRNCNKLESIAKSFHHNSSLKSIYIESCENLKSLPMGIRNLNNLEMVIISECQTLIVSFPDKGLLLVNLRSLQELVIRKCPSNNVSFSEVGFPTNLTSVSINDMASFNEWALYKLTSLKYLEINGHSNSHLVSFPEMMLPSSLIGLDIRDFPNLKYLSSKGFQDLTSSTVVYLGL
jgi:hypothetical protein